MVVAVRPPELDGRELDLFKAIQAFELGGVVMASHEHLYLVSAVGANSGNHQALGKILLF